MFKAIEDRCNEFISLFEYRLVKVERNMEEKASKREVQKLGKEVKELENKMVEMTCTDSDRGREQTKQVFS